MIGHTLLAMSLAVLPVEQAQARFPSVLLVASSEEDNKSLHDAALPPLTPPDQGVMFDLDGDGQVEQVAWTLPETHIAFLAIDHNGNGRIDDGTELVSDRLHPGARDAIQALSRKMPINGPPGWLDNDDPLFSKLLLWTDHNHNGQTESGELRLASEVLARIGLGYVHFNKRDDHGNQFRFQGWVSIRTGPGLNGPESGRESQQEVERAMRSSWPDRNEPPR